MGNASRRRRRILTSISTPSPIRPRTRSARWAPGFCRLPGFMWMQCFATKSWKALDERLKLSLRLDGHNLPWKHPNLAAPNTTYNLNSVTCVRPGLPGCSAIFRTSAPRRPTCRRRSAWSFSAKEIRHEQPESENEVDAAPNPARRDFAKMALGGAALLSSAGTQFGHAAADSAGNQDRHQRGAADRREHALPQATWGDVGEPRRVRRKRPPPKASSRCGSNGKPAASRSTTSAAAWARAAACITCRRSR